MAVEIAQAYVSIIPSAKGFGPKLSGVLGPELDTAGTEGGKRLGKGLTGGVKGAVAGIGGLLAGFGAARFFSDTITEARESIRVGNLTNQVIKSTGAIAGVTAGQVGDLATKLSEASGVDDELVQSGENVLLTFTNVRNAAGKGNDVFNRATGAALDLSQALGQDMQSSVVQLGKALNDPIRGVTALQRVGVSFTKSQRDQIDALVKSGDTLGAQKIILGEVEKEFGGAAAAAADPAAKAQVAWKNFQETLGLAVLPLLNEVATVFSKDIAPAISTAVKGFTSLPGPVKAASIGIIGIGLAAGPIGKVASGIGLLGKGIGAIPGALKAVQTGFSVIGAVLSANPWVLAIAGLVLLAVLIVKNWDKIKKVVGAAVAWIGDRLSELGDFFAGIGKKLAEIFNGFDLTDLALLLVAPFIEVPRLIIRALFGVDIVDKAVEWISGIFDAISGFLSELPGRLEGLLDPVELVKLLFGGIPQLIGKLFGVDLVDMAANGLVSFGQWLATLPGQLLGFLANLGAQLFAFFVTNNPVIQLGLAIVGALPGLAATVIALPGQILGWIGNLAARLFTKGVEIITGIISGLGSAIGGLLSWVAGIPDRIIDTLGDLAKKFLHVGRDIIDGLIQGLKNGIGKLGDVLDKIVDKIKDAVTNPLDIFSPSRWMRDEVGQNLMLGLQIGITTHAPGVIDAARDTVTGLQSQLAAAANSSTVLAPVTTTEIHAHWAIDAPPAIAPLEAEIHARWVIPEAPSTATAEVPAAGSTELHQLAAAVTDLRGELARLRPEINVDARGLDPVAAAQAIDRQLAWSTR